MIQEGSSKLASVPSGGGGAAPAAAGGAAAAAGGEAAPAEEEKEEEKEESDEDVRKRLSMSLMFRWDSDCSIRAQESSIYANRGIFLVIIRLVMSAFCACLPYSHVCRPKLHPPPNLVYYGLPLNSITLR